MIDAYSSATSALRAASSTMAVRASTTRRSRAASSTGICRSSLYWPTLAVMSIRRRNSATSSLSTASIWSRYSSS